MNKFTETKLRDELTRAQTRLAELEATVQAIREGDVDGLVVNGPRGDQIFILQGPEEPYKIIAERMNEGAATLNRDFTILFCNNRLGQMIGIPIERLLGASFLSLLKAEDSVRLESLFCKALDTGSRGEFLLSPENGTPLPVQLAVSSIPMDEGTTGFCVIASDLTDQKRAENEVRRLNADLEERVRLRTAELLQRESDLVSTQRIARLAGWTFDISTEAIAWSEEAFHIFGCDPGQPVPDYQHCQAFFAGDSWERAQKAYEGSVRTGTSYEVELPIIRGDGEKGWIALRGEPVFDGQGKAVQMRGTVQDISERIRAQESMARLSTIVEQSNDAIVSATVDGVVTSWNKGAERLFGYEPSEMLGRSMLGLAPPDDPDALKRHFQELSLGKHLNYEAVRKRKDGALIDVAVSISPILDRNGSLVGVSGISHDITERKRNEEALRESEKAFTTLAELVPQLIWISDADGSVTYLNRRWVEYTGLTLEDRHKKKWSAPVHPEDMENVTRVWRRSLSSGETYRVECRLRASDGGYRWFLLLAEPMRDSSGHSIRWFGSCTDIEDLKRAQKIKSDQARLMERLSDGVFALDRNWCYSYMNEKAGQLIGRRPEELLGKNIWTEYPGAVETNVFEAYNRASEQQIPVFFETHFGPVNRWFDIRVYPSADGLTILYQDVTDRKRAEALREKSEAELRSIVANAPYGVYRTVVENGGRFTFANPAMIRMLGCSSAEEVYALNIERDVYSDPEERHRVIEAMRSRGSYSNLELKWRRRDRKEIILRSSGTLFRTAEGEEVFESVAEDITEQRHLESQLLQAQKMEAVGRLAGGVAHDFNNILGVITGYSEIAKDHISPSHPVSAHLAQIRAAAMRAANLTRQLLMFSRKQVVFPKPLDLNTVVNNVMKMLGRTIGEDVHLSFKPGSNIGSVVADVGQIEQILMNLVVNARDAMPGGGSITLQTRNVELGETYRVEHEAVTPGSYVMLSVEDTGCGMDRAIMGQIFEPFFTTKEPGKGTGLGLATVYGIVKQSGGYIFAYSEVGKGSSFKIYLPRVGTDAEKTPEVTERIVRGGTETILVVEDDGGLRDLTVAALRAAGYTVLEAGGSEEALRIEETVLQGIQLLLTDVVMPKINGSELSDRLKALNPALQVVFMSGYAGEALAKAIPLTQDLVLLEKPFSRSSLLAVVDRVLHGTTTTIFRAVGQPG